MRGLQSVNTAARIGHGQSLLGYVPTILSVMTASRRGLTTRRLAAITMAATASVVLCACGGGSDGPSEPTSASPSVTQETSDAAGESQVADLEGAQVTAPADWKVEFTDPHWIIDPPADDGGSAGGAVFDVDDVSLAEDTEELAVARLKAAGSDGKRLPDVKYGGVTFYHIREQTDVNRFDSYGALVDGSQVALEWTFIKDLASPEQIDRWIDQLMSTFKF